MVLALAVAAGCARKAEETKTEDPAPAEETTGEKMYIPVMAKGFQHQFWQAVKAGADPGYVEALAAFVDGQMKDVSRSSASVDSLRIAVLAALNLADEVFRLRREVEEAQSRPAAPAPSDERIARLATRLGSALGE